MERRTTRTAGKSRPADLPARGREPYFRTVDLALPPAPFRPAGILMRRRAPLHAEPLEPRDTPATFGNPWPDGQHLTLSLAPDGTPTGGQAGNFASFLQQLGPESRLSVL